MDASPHRPASTSARWWRPQRRSSVAPEAAELRRALHAEQPAFWAAVVGDARAAALYRGERLEGRSRFDDLVRVVRLALVTDAFLAQVCYRARVAFRVRRIPLLPTILHRAAITRGQVSIGDHVVMRPGVYLPHGQVVVDGITHIADGVVIRPFVTIGLRDGDVTGPDIGSWARIGTGAKVFGPVRIGGNARVGANAVVIDDVPGGRTAVGVPARLLDRPPSTTLGPSGGRKGVGRERP